MPNFVTIELSRKQVNMNKLIHNEKTGKDYVRIFAPGGGVFFYPVKSIKVDEVCPERVYFSRPEGTELQISYSIKKENIPDTAPNNGKYENVWKTVKIEDLKEMYEEERRIYLEEHGFVSMSVPTEWGKHFKSENGTPYVSVSIPIQKGGEDIYYSFIVPEEKFRISQKMPGMSYFSFPKKYKGTGEAESVDFTIVLKSSVKQSDGSYSDNFEEITSAMLKEYVDAAVERSAVKELFVSTEISTRLTRNFNSSTGKPLVSVSVPVFENERDGKATYYSIVVPSERIRPARNSDFVVLSLFKNGPDGEEYVFTAKKRTLVSGSNNEYKEETKKMSSTEVIKHFESSKQRYREAHESSGTTHTLADEVDESDIQKEQGNNEENIKSAHHRKR